MGDATMDRDRKPQSVVFDDVDRRGLAEHRLTADCRECSRRSFLKGAGVMIGVAAFGLGATDSVALPVAFGTGTAGPGSSEHRYPIPDADGVTIDRKNQLIVVRYQQH